MTPQYIQWTILTSLYVALWKIQLVWKRLIACFQTFASSLKEDALRKGYETEVVDLKTYEPEDDLDCEVTCQNMKSMTDS